MTLDLATRIKSCQLCSQHFAQTKTAHAPRPVVWFRPGTRLIIIGQAPGARVHASGIPFDDASGDRLRDWLGLEPRAFYCRDKVSILPMAFCFPGYDGKGADLPPPPVCAKTWHKAALQAIGPAPLTILVGGYAQKWHIAGNSTVTDTVLGWRDHAPTLYPLPHPSWRNTGWLRKNPWFADELLPELKARVQEVMT